MYEQIRQLNNQATQAIAAGQLERADALLDQVQQLLAAHDTAAQDSAAQDSAAPDADARSAGAPEVDALTCEYFYRCHRIDLAWRREHYAAGLAHAQRGVAIEDALWRLRGADQPDSCAFSHASWGLISMLTRCRQFEQAERVFAALLGDGARFHARRRCGRDALESALLAGLCLYFENPAAGWLERGLHRVERAELLIGTPAHHELLIGLGSFFARLGREQRARHWIDAALGAGVPAARIRDDEDLGPLWQQKKKTGHPGWRWDIQSTPAGAAIWLDDRDTGKTTPATLQVTGSGTHVLRLELAGHAPQVVADTPRSDWSLCPALESLNELEKKRIADAQAAQPTPPEDQQASAAFLGSGKQRAKLRLELQRGGSYGLDGQRIVIDGRGHGEVHVGNYWRKHRPDHARVKLDAADLEAVFAAIEACGLTGIVLANRPGHPDEIHLDITVDNGRGQTIKLGAWASHAPPRFRRLFALGQVVVNRLTPELRALLVI